MSPADRRPSCLAPSQLTEVGLELLQEPCGAGKPTQRSLPLWLEAFPPCCGREAANSAADASGGMARPLPKLDGACGKEGGGGGVRLCRRCRRSRHANPAAQGAVQDCPPLPFPHSNALCRPACRHMRLAILLLAAAVAALVAQGAELPPGTVRLAVSGAGGSSVWCRHAVAGMGTGPPASLLHTKHALPALQVLSDTHMVGHRRSSAASSPQRGSTAMHLLSSSAPAPALPPLHAGSPALASRRPAAPPHPHAPLPFQTGGT